MSDWNWILLFTAIITLIIIDKIGFNIYYKKDVIKKDKKILSECLSFYGSEYNFDYKYKWNIFKPNENYLYVYTKKKNGQNVDLLVKIPTYRIRLLGRDIMTIINQKEKTHFKPVLEILKEVSEEEILEELASYCLDCSLIPKKYGAEHFTFSQSCRRSCCDVNKKNFMDTNQCDMRKNLYSKRDEFIKIYNLLLDETPYETDRIVNLDIQSFKGLSIGELVAAKYKNTQGTYSGQKELTKFVFNLILYLYVKSNS